MLYEYQRQNEWKTWGIMALFIAVVLTLGYYLASIYQNNLIIWVALGFSLIMNIGSYWYSEKIAISSSGAILADESKYRDLHQLVGQLSMKAQLPKPKLYIIEDSGANAFATGRNKENASIAVTTGLLDKLNKEELEGVIAHELAHIGNKDMLVMTVVVILAGFIGYIADMVGRLMFFSTTNEDEGSGVLSFAIMIAVTLVAQIGAFLIQLAVSRNREFLADATGARITKNPHALASALKRIHEAHVPTHSASQATAHLYFANPFQSSSLRSKISNLFETHPRVETRIARLQNMQIL